MRTDDGEDVYLDKGKKSSVSKPAASPEDEERRKIRIKRLANFSSRKTGEGPFEQGDLVVVDQFGYGVVKWLGILNVTKELSAGIEFVRS